MLCSIETILLALKKSVNIFFNKNTPLPLIFLATKPRSDDESADRTPTTDHYYR